MTSIQIVEVSGKDNNAATWVATVTFPQIDHAKLLVVKALMQKKPFNFGGFEGANKRLVIMHSSKPVQRAQCISALEHMFETADLKATIEEVVMFNGYHLELFGFRPKPALSKDVKLSEEEESKIWEELLPSDDTAPIEMADVDKAFQKALNEKEDMVLALRQLPAMPQIGISWCTQPPLELHVATDRRLREWQKLEWVLLRCESEEMRTSPSMAHFADFYSIYRIFSTVENKVDLQKQAFNTFANHVKETTGAIISKKELPPATLNAIRGLQNESTPGKHCQNCNHILSDELMMDINGCLIPKHRHGMFCSSECAKGRCKGCSFPLDKESLCVKRCGIRPHAVVRQATWREYFELYPKLQPEAAAWCQEKLHTSSEELLNSTDRLVSYGGYFQISPDAWF